MSGDKVFVFGSFTEDESKQYQKQSIDTSLPKLEEIKGIQFGSLDFVATLNHQKFSSVPKKQTKSKSSVTSQQVPASGAVIKDKKATTVSVKSNTQLPSQTKALTNGDLSSCDSHSNGVLESGKEDASLASLHISQNGYSDAELLPSPKVQDNGPAKPSNNELAESSLSVNAGLEIHKSTTDKAPAATKLLPRGLINPGNLCFLNATLQALLSCTPFVQLLLDLRQQNIPKIGYPTLLAFVEFISDFDIPNSSSKNAAAEVLETGKSFTPTMFDAVLKSFTPDLAIGISGRTRQEDAQEFLSFLMDRMHDELLKLEGLSTNSNGCKAPLISSVEEDGWETVGPKNKSAVTRTQSFVPSQLSAIFGGQLRSVVKARGIKDSATEQPFLLLHLDIFPDAVHTIEDALRLFSTPENLEGYKASAGKAGVVSASKSVKIQMPSKIMILHLMRFSYGSKGSTKLHKPVAFPLKLVLGREVLASSSLEGRKYELVATITHHGREPSKGHYTTDARYSEGHWLRYDDASLTAIPINKVLHDQAYVLFYKQV